MLRLAADVLRTKAFAGMYYREIIVPALLAFPDTFFQCVACVFSDLAGVSELQRPWRYGWAFVATSFAFV